ncbi:MAG: hypothetical protein ACYC48_00115 [Minisyncoccota bacterium]
MRSRISLLALLFIVGSFALPYVAHASVPFFGPIIPDAYKTCPGGWGLLMVVVNNIIEFLLTIAIVFVAPIMIAYSGFLYVVNPVDPGGIAKAKGILLNTIVGIVVALAAWMIVDAIMAVLYNPSASSGSTVLGTWSSLITTSGDACLPQAGSLPGAELNQATSSTIGVAQLGNLLGAPLSQCPSSNGVCNPSALQAAGFTQTQANIMSCIAMTESSGDSSNPPYNTIHPGSDSTACGLFSITQTTWGRTASGACSNFSNCQNATCNTQVARTLVSQSGYSSWTCAGCNSNAQACINKYGGS